MLYKLYLLTFFFLITLLTTAQTFSGNNYGLNIGLHLAAGTHFDGLGISCNAYYVHNDFQVNPGFKIYYNLKNIGPSKKYIEFAPSLGLIFSFGIKDSIKNLFFSPLGNQTGKKSSIGYAFNYYLNNIKTSQATGSVSFQFGNFQIISEDDVFAGGIRDEFRTGSGLIQYRDKNFQYGINFIGWTGIRGDHVDDPNYPSRNGYMDMSHSLYGNVSAGILSAQVQYAAPYGQIIQGNAGIDEERVRNFFQNKLIHRFFFLPKNNQWRGGSDLPMIDSGGKMYLYKKGQKIRPARSYFNLFTNPNLFY